MDDKWSDQAGDVVVSFLSSSLFAKAEEIKKTKTFIWLSGWKSLRMRSRRPTTLKLGPKFTFSPFSWSFPNYNMTTHIHIVRPHWQLLSRGVEDMIFKDESSVQFKKFRQSMNTGARRKYFTCDVTHPVAAVSRVPARLAAPALHIFGHFVPWIHGSDWRTALKI